MVYAGSLEEMRANVKSSAIADAKIIRKARDSHILLTVSKSIAKLGAQFSIK